MRIDVISIFPEIFDSIKLYGITSKSLDKSLWILNIWNPRLFAKYPTYRVDDRPYGGGPGMVMSAEPLEKTIEAIKKDRKCVGLETEIPVVYLTPTGKLFNNSISHQLSKIEGLIIICGRYEGIDQRLIDKFVTLELSIGDFILSGGEIAALAIIDSIVRFLPGVLNDYESVLQDSFGEKMSGLLDTPHYTRPKIYHGVNVPEVLLNGNHKDINTWRKNKSIEITTKCRPDLLNECILKKN